MRAYLAGKPMDSPVWPGTWADRGADMLRIDLDAAGIPYVVEGPNGPLYADLHSLRHSFIFLCDQAGLTLKTAMTLARHSDPRLTAKVYGKIRQSDLSDAIERLPTLTGKPKPDSLDLAATGTDGVGAFPRLPFPCHTDDPAGDSGGQLGTNDLSEMSSDEVAEVLTVKQNETPGDGLGLVGKSASCRARTYDPLIKSQLLYQLS
jgi:hypothetical protein